MRHIAYIAITLIALAGCEGPLPSSPCESMGMAMEDVAVAVEDSTCMDSAMAEWESIQGWDCVVGGYVCWGLGHEIREGIYCLESIWAIDVALEAYRQWENLSDTRYCTDY